MKTEPDVFSFEDLVRARHMTSAWDGVRNYQARNFMRDQFQVGDKVFIYHSSTDQPGIYGIAEVVRKAYPDHTALDKNSKYYDEKSAKAGQSRWLMVDVQARERLQSPVLLAEMKQTPALADMMVIKRGMRLSIQPVSKDEWDYICKQGRPQAVKSPV